MPMLPLLVLVFLLASTGLQKCHSFKPVKRRIDFHLGLGSVKPLLSSIRGGNYDHKKDNLDEYDETQHFIASFEMKLAEIRRDAEQQAENEIRKLRELIEPPQKDMDIEQEEKDNDEHGDGSDGVYSDPTEDEDILNATNALGQPKDESGGVFSVVENAEVSNQSDDGRGVGNARSRKQESASGDADEHENWQPPLDSELLIQLKSSMRKQESALADDGDNEDLRPSLLKNSTSSPEARTSRSSEAKKRKSRKRSKKTQEKVPEAGKQDKHKLQQHRQSRIWFYLRSDLGHALCLFVGAVLLAMLTQRLQRQAEAEMLI